MHSNGSDGSGVLGTEICNGEQHSTPTQKKATPPPYHMVPRRPLWNDPIPPQHCTLGVLHGTSSAFMEKPFPPPLKH